MRIFDFLKKKGTKNVEFLAQVSFTTKETRFKSSIVICTVLEGALNKNDTVCFIDTNNKMITEGIVSVINHQRKSVSRIEKSNTDSNDIGLEFRDINDKPIENAKFICKFSE